MYHVRVGVPPLLLEHAVSTPAAMARTASDPVIRRVVGVVRWGFDPRARLSTRMMRSLHEVITLTCSPIRFRLQPLTESRACATRGGWDLPAAERHVSGGHARAAVRVIASTRVAYS